MDLTARLLLSILQLSTISNEPSTRMRTAPVAALLARALVPLVPTAIVNSAVSAFNGSASSPDELDQVAAEISSAASTREGQARLEQSVTAVETLLILHAASQASGLGSVQARVAAVDLFGYLGYLILNRLGTAPLTILVGSNIADSSRLEIALGGGELVEQLQMSYVAGDSSPRWRTQLWVRRPPDPTRRRLTDWSDDRLAGASTLELYRRQTPGEAPLGVITTEPSRLPHQLSCPGVDLQLDLPDSQAHVVRTTLRDKYQAPLLVAERVLVGS